MNLLNYINQEWLHLSGERERVEQFSLKHNFTVTRSWRLIRSGAIFVKGKVYEVAL